MAPRLPSLSERLDAILKVTHPKGWAEGTPAPYQFSEAADGRQVLKIITDAETGESIAAAGATKADAIARLEQRLKIGGQQ